MSSFNKYFQEELSYLRELGREFSESYPTLAPMLADRGADPDVERLLEGVAFLTGRIRQKLDDEIPEFIVAVAHLLFPQLVRPLPGATIVEVTPVVQALRDRLAVPRGAEFSSIQVEGTTCTFRSTSATHISPLQIEDARLESLPGGKQDLRIFLRTNSGSRPQDVLPKSLRLHFAGELHEALNLWCFVLENVEEIRVLELLPDGRVQNSARVGKEALRCVTFDDEHRLLPTPNASFPGFRLLQEYYALPQKFAFVDLMGLDAVAGSIEGQEGRFAVSIVLKRRLTDAAPVTKDSIKLHCVPVINVFETSAEPIRLNPMRERFLLRPAGIPAKHAEVYSVERVTTILRRNSARVEIPSFYDFAHVGSRKDQFFYMPHFTPSVVGHGVDVHLSFGTPLDASALPDADTASVDVLATNRSLASSVRAGELRVPTATSPLACTFRNLFAVTPHVAPPFGRELHWRVVAHAATGLRSLMELEVLRSVLDVYNLRAIVDRQSARANELRMDALKAVRLKPSEKLYRGAPVRGIDVDVDLDESGFTGDGDIYLFGAVLDHFFAHYVSLNSYSRTAVNGLSSRLRYSWPARSGSMNLL